MNSKKTTREMTAWENNILGVPLSDLPQLLPGIIAVSILTWASIWASDFLGKELLGFEKSPVSPVMLAIILGLLIGIVIEIPKSFKPGLRFAVKKILRLGIILLGIRLTIFDVFKLGVLACQLLYYALLVL